MILWHNPRCSKSRQALALLTEAGQDPDIRLYLKEPPSRAELEALRTALGLTAAEMIRTGEKTFKEQGLKDADEDTLLDAMAADPILLALAIAFILAMGFLGLSFALPGASPFLRPPPIGPPTAA